MNRRNIFAAGVAGLSAASITSANAQKVDPSNPELEPVKALLKAHHDAMAARDMDGVLATFTEDGAIMGTGPEEMWAGKAELKNAFTNFFEGYDKGEQDFESDYRIGALSSDMGWMLTSGTVKGKLKGVDFALPLNMSLTVSKKDGAWKIAAMHFSTVPPEEYA
tara:strand:+ start:1871 stop:2362 length:492 start_codon:yes stop_codon:yes gene_type:complete